tara:strand:- start:136 stop:381 length:246 start_codon:yes stop_codon:yes gene_type:complete
MQIIANLEVIVKKTSAALQVFPRGNMGLTPDDVKASPEYKTAKADFDAVFKALRNANRHLTSHFRLEYRAYHRAKQEERKA